MRGKILKSALLFSVLASILVATFAIAPAFGQGVTLDAPCIVDAGLEPGDTFSIDITVHDVMGMLGYDFRLCYDPSVLTATAFESYAPFTQEWGIPGIHPGYVEMAYSYPIPEWFGLDVFPGDDPYPIAKIDFEVAGWGMSCLQLEDTVVSNVNGGWYDHYADSGAFSNVGPVAGAYVGLTTGFLENRHFKVSKEPDALQTLTAQVENMGPVTTTAKAKFRIVDSMGGLVANLMTSPVYIDPGQTLRLSADLDTTGLDLPETYYVEVQVYYISSKGCCLGRKGGPDAAKSTFVTQFKLEA